MAGSLNKVQLIGTLGADPETRRLSDGRAIVNMRVATSEYWRDKNSGERKEKTEWHTVTIFSDGLAKVADSYLRKGSKVYVEGQLQTRKWQDKDGNDRYSTEVVLQGFSAALVLLDSPQRGEGGDKPRQDATKRDSYGNKQPANFNTALDDDIPFMMEWR